MTDRTAISPHLAGVDAVGAPYVFGRWHKNAFTTAGFRYEARVFLRSRLGPRREGPKFLIIGRARSGTTLLCRLLNEAPDIHCALEVLHNRVLSPRRFLNDLAARRRATVYGCKLLSFQMAEVQSIADPTRFLQDLRQDGWRFVHIVRETAAQCLSLSTAQASKNYFHEKARGTPVGDGGLSLDPDRFVRQVRWNRALLAMETELMQAVPHERVDYEVDLADPARHQATVDRLCDALGARRCQVSAPIRKVLTRPFEQLVSNAADVRRALNEAGLDEAQAL